MPRPLGSGGNGSMLEGGVGVRGYVSGGMLEGGVGIMGVC